VCNLQIAPAESKWRDVMSCGTYPDLSSRSDKAIEKALPEGFMLMDRLSQLPESYVVTVARRGRIAGLDLESYVLFAVEEVEATKRSRRVRPVHNYGDRHSPHIPNRDFVGDGPTGALHGANELMA
jgi:hypothetical protein